AELGDRIDRRRQRIEAARKIGRELPILGLDERGDLLQEHDESGREARQVGELARRDDDAIEIRERGVVLPLRVEALALEASALFLIGGPHVVLMLFCGLQTRQLVSPEFDDLEMNYSPWLPADRNAAVLDAGCGRGRVLAFLASRGYARLEGFDRDPAAAAAAPAR